MANRYKIRNNEVLSFVKVTVILSVSATALKIEDEVLVSPDTGFLVLSLNQSANKRDTKHYFYSSVIDYANL
ncbi:hypothetical protein [Reichenbachiella versicolor]|uniref:hypothetical protein n=1 Tax=Reichenbachiella versicolor TaxID=1821036 RepID=UPI000D6E4936|nr:hypothetical protein [Reichenbachiella versicolor]